MMAKKYSMISDISFVNSATQTKDELKKLFDSELFSDSTKWEGFSLVDKIDGLLEKIKSRMKYKMSTLSLGVYGVLESGPGANLIEDEQILLFSGFTEINTINKIGQNIMTQNFSINPTLFPNSVQHISLCYFTILHKKNNYCATITDGLSTNLSFIDFIKNKVKLDSSFVVVAGEENSGFFDYESELPIRIVPSYVGYRVKPNSPTGFLYIGSFQSLDRVRESEVFKSSPTLFCDKESFGELTKDKSDKRIYCDYPITGDNPSAIAFRVALPFYLEIKGRSIIIEKIDSQYHCFEVQP